MKSTTIVWHNVETDGYPNESGQYLTYSANAVGFWETAYSAKHKMFNVYDNYDFLMAKKYAVNITYWAEIPNFNGKDNDDFKQAVKEIVDIIKNRVHNCDISQCADEQLCKEIDDIAYTMLEEE